MDSLSIRCQHLNDRAYLGLGLSVEGAQEKGASVRHGTSGNSSWQLKSYYFRYIRIAHLHSTQRLAGSVPVLQAFDEVIAELDTLSWIRQICGQHFPPPASLSGPTSWQSRWQRQICSRGAAPCASRGRGGRRGEEGAAPSVQPHCAGAVV